MEANADLECPLVSVVIVNYSSGSYLAACVRSVLESAYPRKELIIVDNASLDDPVRQVEAFSLKIRIVRNPVNLGYSGGGDIGIAEAKGEFVVDVEVTLLFAFLMLIYDNARVSS